MRAVTVSFSFFLLLAVLTPRSEYLHADDAGKTPSPILVELFTSEGCSSCPPADALLQKIDSTQPIAGAHLIVLSEHVDYWDHDGWRDPYSSHSLTERQDAYARAFGLPSAYTPQIIVDGSNELRGGQHMNQVFQKALATPKLPVQIGSVKFDSTLAPTIHAHIDAQGLPTGHADVYVALAIDHADSQVLRGENSGRHLTHVAVVRSLSKIGKLEKGKNFGGDVVLKLSPGMNATNTRLVAFVQEPDQGRVLAGAMWKSAN